MHFIKNDLIAIIIPFSLYFILGLSACKENDDDIVLGEPSTLYFEKSYDISNEGDGIKRIYIKMDHAQITETVVHFKVSGNASDDSKVQKDYEVLTESPLIIKKGETYTAIEIKIHEDAIFEQELENIIFNIDGILEGNAELSSNTDQLVHVHEIAENDYLLYLEWDSDQAVDLNMFIELPDKSLISATDESSFEEVVITNVKEQEHYFLDIWYQRGEIDVNYQLSGLFAGENERKHLLNGSFNFSNAGKNLGNQTDYSIQNYTMIKDGRTLKVLK